MASNLGVFTRDSAMIVTDGILYNSRRQQEAQARADRKADAIETASFVSDSTYYAESTYDSQPQQKSQSKSAKNGTSFSVQELKDKALKSQIRIGI